MSEIFMTREETAKALRISLRTVDSLIMRGEIRVRRIGRRVLIPTEEVNRFAANLSNRDSAASQLFNKKAPATA